MVRIGALLVLLVLGVIAPAHAEPGASVGRHLVIDAQVAVAPIDGEEVTRIIWLDVAPLPAGGYRTCVFSGIRYSGPGSRSFDVERGCADDVVSFDAAGSWRLSGEIVSTGTRRDGSTSLGTVTLDLAAVPEGRTGLGCSNPYDSHGDGVQVVGRVEATRLMGTLSGSLSGAFDLDNVAACDVLGVGSRTG